MLKSLRTTERLSEWLRSGQQPFWPGRNMSPGPGHHCVAIIGCVGEGRGEHLWCLVQRVGCQVHPELMTHTTVEG